jgi:predicted CoA-substrate-specific enzyme activase
MNDKCAAGTGRFLEVMADVLHIPLAGLGEISLSAQKAAEISNTCTVFAEQEVINQLANGETVPNLIAGIHEAIATRVFGLVSKLKIEPDVAVTGGGAKNAGLVKALEGKFGVPLLVPPEPLLTGALGAAIIGRENLREARQNRGGPRKERRKPEGGHVFLMSAPSANVLCRLAALPFKTAGRGSRR